MKRFQIQMKQSEKPPAPAAFDGINNGISAKPPVLQLAANHSAIAGETVQRSKIINNKPTGNKASKLTKIKSAGKAPVFDPGYIAEVKKDNAERLKNDLIQHGVSEKLAGNLAENVENNPNANEGDSKNKELATNAVKAVFKATGELQLVGVDEKKVEKVIKKISESENPEQVAEESVGEAATEEVFGKEVAALVPQDKRGKFREVFKQMHGLYGELQLIGGDPDDPDVLDAVKEAAKLGATQKDELKEVLNKAAHKVLDKQGFDPAEEGETASERLDKIAKLQNEELRKMNAAKAAAALKKKFSGFKNTGGKGKLLPGASGSSLAGKSVSAKQDVAIGGGRGKASGAGNAKTGTGIDRNQHKGSGGRNHDKVVDHRLAAGAGGTAIVGNKTGGQGQTPNQPGHQTGTKPSNEGGNQAGNQNQANKPVPGATHNRESKKTADLSGNMQPPNNQHQDNTQTNNTAGNQSPPTAKVIAEHNNAKIGSEVSGGNFFKHYENGEFSADITFNANFTFTGMITVKTTDEFGKVVLRKIKITGTWFYDENGNEIVTSSTTSPEEDNNNQSKNDDDDNDDDNDDDDDNSNDDKDQTEQDEQSQEQNDDTSSDTEQSTEESTTPNPLDERSKGMGSLELFLQTGGRLGGAEARQQAKALALASWGGGKAGPAMGEKASGVFLTKDELSNALKLLNIKQGGSITTPSPDAVKGGEITERDLMELHLRGSGSAMGPREGKPAPVIHDPKSPLNGPGPIKGSSGSKLSSGLSTALKISALKFERAREKALKRK